MFHARVRSKVTMSILLDFVPPGRTLGKLGQRMCPAGVFIKARWAALARPVELLARAEAPAWARELELAQGLGLPCTPKKSQAGRS